jgi:hypothetical protein
MLMRNQHTCMGMATEHLEMSEDVDKNTHFYSQMEQGSGNSYKIRTSTQDNLASPHCGEMRFISR